MDQRLDSALLTRRNTPCTSSQTISHCSYGYSHRPTWQDSLLPHAINCTRLISLHSLPSANKLPYLPGILYIKCIYVHEARALVQCSCLSRSSQDTQDSTVCTRSYTLSLCTVSNNHFLSTSYTYGTHCGYTSTRIYALTRVTWPNLFATTALNGCDTPECNW